MSATNSSVNVGPRQNSGVAVPPMKPLYKQIVANFYLNVSMAWELEAAIEGAGVGAIETYIYEQLRDDTCNY